jgi:hypothetical protein
MKNLWKLSALLFLTVGMLTLGAVSFSARAASPDDVPAAENARITVAHFAPFASTVVSTSVTVRVNGADVITDFVFAETVSGISLPAGIYTIELVPTGGITPALTITAPVSEGKGSQKYNSAH